MRVSIEPQLPERLIDANLRPRGTVFRSPVSWRDQVFYFLMPDRFSDGREAERPRYDRTDPQRFRTDDPHAWMQAGMDWQGGTLRGIISRLDYLRRMGVTTLWIGPIWRQRAELDTYHGYGIQNFLDIDPRLGTRQDLRDLVAEAHRRRMYVVLDIIINHTGNNFYYLDQQSGQPVTSLPYRYAPPYPFGGWRSRQGVPIQEITSLDDGVWPREFQDPDWYTRAGSIGRWDTDSWESPLHSDVEFRRGDFFDLKDLNLARADVRAAVAQVYQYWIALSDCDGFRIDTVKHMSLEASRNFCNDMREYTEAIGKENFLLLGEVTGGAEMARNYLDIFGRNIDAVLDIGEPMQLLTGFVKGSVAPAVFFDQYRGHDALAGHRETGRYHVSLLDDHDMVGRGGKHRFAANNPLETCAVQTAHAVGTLLLTLGIPCIYYGTEQAFDGTQNRHDPALGTGFEDRYVRESMFGGTFGAFMTSGCHFFDEQHPTYQRIAALNRVRSRRDAVGKALRRGRQYLRDTSFLDRPFGVPPAGELAAWSRILYRQEVLVALNTHGAEPRGAHVTVDAELSPPGSRLHVLYRGDWSDEQLRQPPDDESVLVQQIDGRATVRLDLPPAGMVVLANLNTYVA